MMESGGLDHEKIDSLLSTIDSLSKNESEKHLLGKRPMAPEMEHEAMEIVKKAAKRRFAKKKKPKAFASKTALMKLNETYPGLSYLVENIGGPPHMPNFKATVAVNDQKFEGVAKSKQLAKLAAAASAIRTLIQFPDMAEREAVLRHTDSLLNDESPAAKVSTPSGDSPTIKAQECTNKNPLMLVNEKIPGLVFELVSEKGHAHAKTFTMTVEYQGESFMGYGSNKKSAKIAAAASLLDKKFGIKVSLDGAGSVKNDVDVPDAMNYSNLVTPIPQEIAENIGSHVNSSYEDLMKGLAKNSNYKVLASILMTNNETEEMKVISLSTGTKCVNGEHISVHGASINDCHAEIVSRRCLIDFLYTQLEQYNEKSPNSILEKKESGKFGVKEGIKFHLYINTAPCGDARIFSPKESNVLDQHPLRKCRGQLRTKIESGEGTIPVINSENTVQTWDSILAGKRLLTMSCSDKLSRWIVLGMQGSLLSHLLEPVYLDTITLGSLYHPDHMYRALCGRYQSHLADLPEAYQVRLPAMGATISKTARQVAKAPNYSINWTTGQLAPEVVDAVSGKIDNQTPSRLSKLNLFKRFCKLKKKFPLLSNIPNIYADAKNAAVDHQTAKRKLYDAYMAAGCGHWMKKPIEQDQFSSMETF